MEERFTTPPGFTWHYFTDAATGARVRYGCVQPDGQVKSTIVLTGGFTEPAEKYFEVIRERTAKGAAVWVMDWPGQGGSDRFLPEYPLRSHHTGFEKSVAVLHQFATRIVTRPAGVPLVLMAHSMGGHIGLRTLAAHPDVFDRAILTDPMLRFSTGALPEKLARIFATAAVAAGLGTAYVPGGNANMVLKSVFMGNPKTSDPVRFRVQPDIFARDPVLQAGPPTFGWVAEAFKSCDILNRADVLESIKTPVLMQISGPNAIILRAPSQRAAALLQNCIRVDIPEAKHEIWMEKDALREIWLGKVDKFLDAASPLVTTSRPSPTL